MSEYSGGHNGPSLASRCVEGFRWEDQRRGREYFRLGRVTELNATPVGFGFIDEAFELLGRGFEVRDTWMIFLLLPQWRFFDSLRNDPRFTEMVERLGAR